MVSDESRRSECEEGGGEMRRKKKGDRPMLGPWARVGVFSTSRAFGAGGSLKERPLSIERWIRSVFWKDLLC